MEMRQAIEEYLSEFHKPENYIVIKKCPYCDFDSFMNIAYVDRHGLPCNIVICNACNGCFKSSILTPEVDRRFYEHLSYLLRGKSLSETDMEKLFWERVANLAWPRFYFISYFLKLNPQEDSVYELGCNDGANLFPWHEQGFETVGIEIDPRMAEFGRKKGLNIICDNFFNFKSVVKKPKLIILSHVLEHVDDIKACLQYLREIISPTGYIFIEVPGIKSQGFGNMSNYFDIEHNFNFDLRSLSEMVKKYSLSVLYGDEYICLLCTPSKKNLINGQFNFFDIAQWKALFFKACIRRIDENPKNLYSFLKEGRDGKNIFKLKHKILTFCLNQVHSAVISMGRRKACLKANLL